MASPDWLARSLPRLVEAEADCPLRGSAVTHFDMRSDNMCITTAGVKFIDWAEACLGNPRLNLGFFLPSLAFEGGPRPQSILPNAPEVAAWVSGYFAAHAGLPVIPNAPFVRRVQREQLSTALPWVVEALRLGEL
jgi:aminoglycoside phosphotransferase (APT) family kinase protein